MRNKLNRIEELTGAVRVRRGWFGGLVLQTETTDGWRDALTEDLATLRLHACLSVQLRPNMPQHRHPVLMAADRVDEHYDA